MQILITGHSGFVGTWLTSMANCIPLVKSNGDAVDLRERASVATAIKNLNFDAVIHLAAQSSVPEAFRNPIETYEVNFLGTQNLLEGLKGCGFTGRILYISSADIYGVVSEHDLPTTEEARIQPLNPYSVSKASAELLCRYWHSAENLDIVVARSFNHIGPGQSTRFALADFCKAIVEMKLGLRPAILEVGDLDVTRDFTDVRDVVRAYLLLLKTGRAGDTYNVCSGQERHLGDTVRLLAELAGVNLQIKVDSNRLRKASQRRAVGCNSKLQRDTGWTPAIAWQQTLSDMMDDFKKQLQ